MDLISMQKLREYQERSIAELRQCFKKGKKRVVVVLPTGSGKTSVAAGIAYNAKAYNKKIIFLAHRQELVYQAHTRFAQWGINAGIIMPPHKNYGHTVNIASIQTLIRREHYDADIVFVDECHHVNSKSYMTILKRYPNAYVIGLTATPFRTDGKPLGDIFHDIITPINTKELIDLKYLVPPKYYGHKKDFRYIKTKMGEYDNKELFDAFDKSQLYGEVVSEFKRLGTGKAIVFNVNIVHSSKTCEAFRNAGYSAAHLDHETKDDERKQILSDFASGKYQILCNVSLFTEGYDLPDINTVILNRATKSKCLFMQMIGRGLRPAEGKENCIVIDHGGNVYEHGMVEDDIVYDIFKKKSKAKKQTPDEIRDNAKQCPACMTLVSIRCVKCPHCEYEFPLPEPVETELEEIKTTKIIIPPHLRKRWSEMTDKELTEFAEIKNYKKGWIWHQKKIRNDTLPPSIHPFLLSLGKSMKEECGGDETHYVCKKCGVMATINTLKRETIPLPNGGYHIKGVCPGCGAYIKFLPHKERSVING